MSYVDLIIKYLSGDLSQEESTSFEKELENNEELRLAFEEHSAAFELIRDQVQKRDQLSFKAKLAEIMSPHAQPGSNGKPLRQSWWFIPPAIASAVAIVLILLFHNPGNEQILSRHHHPESDPVLLAHNQNTRGEPDSGISHYHLGNYSEAMEALSEQLRMERDNKVIMVYYLLSAMELDLQQEVLQEFSWEQQETMDLLDQCLGWYYALALVKSDKREAALELLHILTEQMGPYQTDAIKLEKVLLK